MEKAKLSLTAMGRIMKLGGSPRISKSGTIALAEILEEVGKEIVADAVVIRETEKRTRTTSVPVVKGRNIKTAYKLWRKKR